jgi:methionyl-tRNA formyltransferase
MKFVAFVNNRLGYEVLRWLAEHHDHAAAIVVHPESRAKYRQEILGIAREMNAAVFDASTLQEPSTIAGLRSVGAELGLSVLFGYVLDRELLGLFGRGCLNLHPALLPYNRGAHPNVWTIVDRTPAGVTLHYMDDEIDTGDVIAQQQVQVEPIDTGGTLHAKLEQAALGLFRATWPIIRAGGNVPRTPQPREGGSSHVVRDVAQLDYIDLDRAYVARDLIDVLRARTFPPHPGAYFREDGRKVFVRVQLHYEGEDPNG